MIYVMLRFTVEDLQKWKRVFEESSGLRKNASSVGVRAFAKTDSSNEVVVLAQFADKEKAMRMYQSEELREAMQRAGVNGPPEITYLDEVAKLPS